MDGNTCSAWPKNDFKMFGHIVYQPIGYPHVTGDFAFAEYDAQLIGFALE